MDNIEFQYYLGGVKSNIPKGLVDLETFVESHRNPRESTLKLLGMIAQASSKGDKNLKVSLKERLPFVTPAVIVDGRRNYDHIVRFTGLAQLDWDGVDQAVEIRDHIFETYPQIVTAYVSPSKKGVKALVRVPIVETVDEFQEYYAGLAEEFEQIDGFDPSPKNAVLPLFWSYDYFIRSRDNPEIWEQRGRKKQEVTVNSYPMPRVPYRPLKRNEKHKRRAINTFRKMMRDIVDSPGHPRLRSACIILGTRCGAGYLDEYEARDMIDYEIKTNSYLAKGIKGYLVTADWAFTEGLKTPKRY